MKNRIYFFTGTGNGLKLAKDISGNLVECELVAIKNGMDFTIPTAYERIGFVYPVYYGGLPAIVKNFIQNANFPKQGNTYYFAVATYGGFEGNSLAQLNLLLKSKKITLHYGAKVKMFSNCITLYNMKTQVQQITEKSEKAAVPVIQGIVNKKSSLVAGFLPLLNRYYGKLIQRTPTADRWTSVSDDCTSCGICQKVCAAGNIQMVQGKPSFQHHCEQCTACIQHCPLRAINYKDKTQKRRRYTNPQVGYKELSKYYQ